MVGRKAEEEVVVEDELKKKVDKKWGAMEIDMEFDTVFVAEEELAEVDKIQKGKKTTRHMTKGTNWGLMW